MKQILFGLALLCAASLSAQITFTAPVAYVTGVPTGAPSAQGSRVRVDLLTNNIYQWNPTASQWEIYPRGFDQTSGIIPPAYVPGLGDSEFAINGVDSMYRYRAGAWRHLNPGGSGGGATNLTFTGASSPFTLNSSTGTDVTFAQGIGITLSRSSNELTVTNSAPDQTVTITGATGTYPNFALPLVAVVEGYGVDISGTTTRTVTVDTSQVATPYDVSQAQQTVSAGTGISVSQVGQNYTVTNTAPDQTVSIAGNTGVTIGGTYPDFTVSVSDQSATNELNTAFTVTGGNLRVTDPGGNLDVPVTDIAPVQAVAAGTGISISGTTTRTITNTAPDQTVTITGGGINAVTGTYPNFTVTGTEIDGSTTNELQTISTGTNTLTLSSGGGTVTVDTDPSTDLTTTTGFSGDVSGTYDNLQLGSGVVGPTELAATAVTAGTYGSASQVAQITVDADGRITNAANVTITGDGWGAQVVEHGSTLTGNGTSGSPLDVATDGITNTQIAADAVGQSEIAAGAVGSSELQSTAVAAGSYTLTNITVDADGRITAAANGTEIDGDPNNELQTIANTGDATSHTVTLSNSGGSLQIIEGTGIGLATGGTSGAGTVTVTNTAPDQMVSITGAGINAVTGTYPNFTVTGTEVDGSTTNEINTTFQVSGGELEITDPAGTLGVPVEDIAPVQALTAGTGITITGTTNKTIDANLSTGISGGQSAIGGTGGGENLTLSSTSNATKGSIRFGTTSVFNEVNNRLGINTTSPSATLHLLQQSIASVGSGSGTAGTTLFTMTGTAGGATSAGSGTVFGGNGGGGTITGGAGGAITGTPGTGFGGTGGSFVFTGGNGGTGSTFGGTGGHVEIAGGTGGFGPTAGSSGYASIKGGNAATSSNGAGGNVYVVPGIGDGGGPNGAIYLGLSPSLTQRGNVKIGGSSFPDELLTLGESGAKRGVASFAGETSGKVIVQPAAAAGSWSLTLPTTDGDAGQVLQTNGSGVSSWQNDAGLTAVTTDATLTGDGTGGDPLGVSFPILAPNGSSIAPSYSFSSSGGTGVYYDATTGLNLKAATEKDVTVNAGAGAASNGGNIVMTSGAAGSGDGGYFSMFSGSGQFTGGYFSMTAGEAQAAGGTGGSFAMNAGAATEGTGGGFEMVSGAGQNGGNFSMASGTGTAGAGGGFTMSSGATSGSGATGGTFLMESGDGPNGNGGQFIMRSGSGLFGGSFIMESGASDADEDAAGAFAMSAGDNIGIDGGGGEFLMQGGDAPNGFGGVITINAGLGSTQSRNGYVRMVGNGLKIPSLTTTQRNNLLVTSFSETIIYNSTNARPEFCNSASWKPMVGTHAAADFYADANNTGTGETDLYSYTLPANYANANGDKIAGEWGGTFNDVTATVQIKVYFDGVLIADSGALTVSSTGSWNVDAVVTRVTNTTGRARIVIATPGATAPIAVFTSDLTGLDFTATSIFKITATAGGAGGGSSDITGKSGTVTFTPKA